MAALACLAHWANKAVKGGEVRDGNAAVPKTGQPESRTGESAGEPEGASEPGEQSPVRKFDTNSLAVPKARIHPAITGESQEWQRQ